MLLFSPHQFLLSFLSVLDSVLVCVGFDKIVMILDDIAKQIPYIFWILTITTVCIAVTVEHASCPNKIYRSSFMLSEDDDVSQTSYRSDQPHEMNTKSSAEMPVSDSTALAVVLYKETALLPHEKKNRSFNIAGHEFYIEQDWHSGGVAAVVWDAAVVLGNYLASNSYLVQDKQVLELGAGTGLAGMVASSLGADVILTERKQALPFLQTAISSNQRDKKWKLKVEELDWTHDLESSKWNNFDLVIGADIVYIESTFSHLLKTIKSVAKSPKTQVLLSCRIRYDRDLQFLNMLKKFYTVEEIFYDSKLDIKIFSAVFSS